MNMRDNYISLPKDIKQFLKENLELIRLDDMDTLFTKAEEAYRNEPVSFSVADIGKVLEDADIQVLDKLERIPYGYFEDNKTLNGIIIPEHIKLIQAEAFYNCRYLQEVKLPQNLEEIQDSAFTYCSDLSYIELPRSLKYLGNDAFYASGLKKCRFLGTINEFKNIELGDNIFQGCDYLSNIMCDDGFIEIDNENGDPIL